MRHVITYDIRKDKRRTRLFHLLESYGAWKQYSVFEMELTSVQRVQIEARINNIIDDEDHVRIYALCDRCTKQIIELGSINSKKSDNVI